jgi:membrane-bound serine protease (ClpP class)
MTWPVMVCLIVGLVFVMIEIFQPGFGVFGTIGLLLLVLGIVLRAVFSQEEDNILAQIFIMLFFISIIIILAFIIMVKSSKMGWLSRTPLIEKSTAVSSGISEGTHDYTRLKDKIGIATTDMRPIGKIRIDDEILDAQAEGFYIKKGEGVKVIETRGGTIIVRRFEQ